VNGATGEAAGDRRFPPGFDWGTATAAHQIEGGNTNNDWWEWEHDPATCCTEPSGDACDSWHRWPDDVAAVADMGLGSYRFSLEWSRIEPAEGEWSSAAVAHYRRVAEALIERGITPVMTFHHFTTPTWLSRRGGWENRATADAFVRFCERTARELAPVMGRVCTLNEPNMVSFMGYAFGMFPPGATDMSRVAAVDANFLAAHRGAVEAIRAQAPGVPVGLTVAMMDFQPVDGGEEQAAAARAMEDLYLDATDGDDFIGVQTYSRMRVGPDGPLGPEPGVPVVSTMGYEVWPEALGATIRRTWERTGGRRIYVTENGIATDDDGERIDFVRRALSSVLDCLADGIDVAGYKYWSLLDNFEWALGYTPRFGLVEVDRAGGTFDRRPKGSAAWFGDIARSNRLPAM
jgi:beta-glucosidase